MCNVRVRKPFGWFVNKMKDVETTINKQTNKKRTTISPIIQNWNLIELFVIHSIRTAWNLRMDTSSEPFECSKNQHKVFIWNEITLIAFSSCCQCWELRFCWLWKTNQPTTGEEARWKLKSLGGKFLVLKLCFCSVTMHNI